MHSFTFVTALLGLSASVKAHMMMNTPVPANPSTTTTSPLDGESILYPCQAGTGGVYDGESTVMEAGGRQSLAFTGSAAHGGGSCQISVTYENPPPADQSKWKVIHTILGGCPSSAAGNVPPQGTGPSGFPEGRQCAPGESGECISSFEFPIPSELMNGDVFVAWTWFNKIGNREMYMTCAAAQITGGSDDPSFVNGLPSMFVANIPGECQTSEGVLDIPNPGESIERNGETDEGALGTCTASNGAPSNGGVVQGPANDSADDSVDESVGNSSPNFGGNDGNTVSGGNSFGFNTDDGSSSGETVPDRGAILPEIPDTDEGTSSEDPVTPPAAAAPVNDLPVNSPSADSSGCGAGFISCETPNSIVCVGDSGFGHCDIDNCARVKPLSQGSVCRNGLIARKVKRSVRQSSARHGLLHSQHRRRLAEGGSY